MVASTAGEEMRTGDQRLVSLGPGKGVKVEKKADSPGLKVKRLRQGLACNWVLSLSLPLFPTGKPKQQLQRPCSLGRVWGEKVSLPPPPIPQCYCSDPIQTP